MRTTGTALLATLVLLLAGLHGCDDGVVTPTRGDDLVLEVDDLRSLDPESDGIYEAWVVAGSDNRGRPAGRFSSGGRITLENPVDDPRAVVITVEPPGDDDEVPSDAVMLGGEVAGTRADLSINGFVTRGRTRGLVTRPGTHVLFTPSDNPEEGFPSNEDAGIWVFNIDVRKPERDPELCDPETGRATGEWEGEEFFVDFEPLRSGWVYEGWMVRDHGTDDAIWLSYGKLRVSDLGKASAQDDTGLGPLSGREAYVGGELARLHCFPGDDWVSNPFGLELPDGLELPVDLNGTRDRDGNVIEQSRWTHVITVEPAFDVEGEGPDAGPGAILEARPFTIRPYRNPIGEAAPDEPRTIEFHEDGVPSGTATFEVE